MKTSSYILVACIVMAVTMSVTSYETVNKTTKGRPKWQQKQAVAAEAIQQAAKQAIDESSFTCSATASSKSNSIKVGDNWFVKTKNPSTTHNTCFSCNPNEPKWLEWEYENNYGQEHWTAKEEGSLLGTYIPNEEVPSWIQQNNCA